MRKWPFESASIRKEREGNFETIEEPLGLTQALSSLDRAYSVVIIDCLTLWLNNLMAKWGEDEGFAPAGGRPGRRFF